MSDRNPSSSRMLTVFYGGPTESVNKIGNVFYWNGEGFSGVIRAGAKDPCVRITHNFRIFTKQVEKPATYIRTESHYTRATAGWPCVFMVCLLDTHHHWNKCDFSEYSRQKKECRNKVGFFGLFPTKKEDRNNPLKTPDFSPYFSTGDTEYRKVGESGSFFVSTGVKSKVKAQRCTNVPHLQTCDSISPTVRTLHLWDS